MVVVDPLGGLGGGQWEESLYLGGGSYAHQCQNVQELSGVKVKQSPDEGEDLLFLRGLDRVEADQEVKHLDVT